MLEIRIENYVPINVKGATEEWDLDHKEGEYFSARCESKDGQVNCTYYLDYIGETTETKAVDRYSMTGSKTINYKKKTISQNDGNGVVRLYGGFVSKRFGFFRRKKFQDFLDKFNINSVKSIAEFGYDTTFIIDNTERKKSKLFIPKDSKIVVINNFKSTKINKSPHMAVGCSKSDGWCCTKIIDAPFWIFEEIYYDRNEARTQRKLYAPTTVLNVMDLESQIDEMFIDNTISK